MSIWEKIRNIFLFNLFFAALIIFLILPFLECYDSSLLILKWGGSTLLGGLMFFFTAIMLVGSIQMGIFKSYETKPTNRKPYYQAQQAQMRKQRREEKAWVKEKREEERQRPRTMARY